MTKEELKKWLKGQCDAYKLRLEAVKELEKLAKAACQAGDPADLHDAREAADRPSTLPPLTEIDANLKKFGEGDPELKKIRDMIEKIIKEVEATLKRVRGTRIIDFKKLASALKLDKCPDAAEKLKKALGLTGGARKKALEDLQTECKVKFSSKHMEALMKAESC
jgi:hypothetical protein